MDIDYVSSSSSTTYIPVDIILTILSRLPIKSLCRFRTVCKSWNANISDPWFARIHLHQSKASNSDILFVQQSSPGPLCYQQQQVFFSSSGSVNLEFARLGSAVLCTCEGVVLIKLTDSSYALWNPSIHTKTTIWCPYNFQIDKSTGKGLCYDPSTNDFKVVFIDARGRYAVYSCKNNTWIVKETKVQYCDFRGLGTPSSSGVFVNGAVYWVTNYGSEIIHFDPKDDEVKTLQKLEHVEGNEPFYNLVCLGGRLCLYCNVRLGRDETAVRIWVKDVAGSWVEGMTIKNVMQRPIEPLCFVGNNNKILLRVDGTRFMVYSPLLGGTFEELFEDVSEFGSLVPCEKSVLFPTQSLRQKKRKRYHQLASWLEETLQENKGN